MVTNRDGFRYEYDSPIIYYPIFPYVGLSRVVDFFNSIPDEAIPFLERKLTEQDIISKASSILLLGLLFVLKTARKLMTEERFQVIASSLLDGPKCEDVLDYIRNYESELWDDKEKQSLVLTILEYDNILDFIRESNEWESMDGYDDFGNHGVLMFKILAETALDLSKDEEFPPS